jgi:hypothetical protein
MSGPARKVHYSGESTATDTMSIPVSLLQKMTEAAWMFEAFQDELEDYLLSRDAAFLSQMRQARAHHLKGETHPLDELKQGLCIEERPPPSLTKNSAVSTVALPGVLFTRWSGRCSSSHQSSCLPVHSSPCSLAHPTGSHRPAFLPIANCSLQRSPDCPSERDVL